MNTCSSCGGSFEAKRKDAKFCSGACRAKFNRTDNKRTDNLTEKRTDNSGEEEQRYCHGCGKKSPSFECICYRCIADGKTHQSLGMEDCPDFNLEIGNLNDY